MGKKELAKKEKTSVEKSEKFLENAEVDVWRIYQNTTIHNIVLSWRVPNYEKLEPNIMHFQTYESVAVKCILRLVKSEDYLYLCVCGASLPKQTPALFSILDEKTLDTVNQEAENIKEGVYVARFENKVFLSPKLQFLRQGVLTVSFKYASDRHDSYREEKLECVEILKDLDDLCCDLKNMYLESLFPDFSVHVGDYTFKTHRFILGARSEYFEELFMKKKDVKEYTLVKYFLPGIAHEVFLYMYCSDLKEIDWNCMLRVYELADYLRVRALRSRFLDYFREKITRENYMDVVEYYEKTSHPIDLKNIVISFFIEKKLVHRVFDAEKMFLKCLKFLKTEREKKIPDLDQEATTSEERTD